MVYTQLTGDLLCMEFSVRFESAIFFWGGGWWVAKNHERKEFEVCAYISSDPKVIHTNFIPVQGVILLRSDICARNIGFTLWAHSPMEESVARLLKAGRRTTHQFALRLGSLFIYGLINEGA